MCYNAAYYARKLEKIEERIGELSIDKGIWEEPVYQMSAFSNGKLPVITYKAPRQVEMINWGFVPAFARDVKDGEKWRRRSYNCRADTLLEKLRAKKQSMFKPLVNKPSVILMDGFYEWHTLPDKTKIPYFITMKDGYTFPVAGMVSQWRDFAESERTYTGTTLCTTRANNMLGFIHNVPTNSQDFRMPGILDPEDIDAWLDTSLPATDRLGMIRPYPPEAMEACSVVNFLKKDTTLKKPEDVLKPHDHHVPSLPVTIDGADFDM